MTFVWVWHWCFYCFDQNCQPKTDKIHCPFSVWAIAFLLPKKTRARIWDTVYSVLSWFFTSFLTFDEYITFAPCGIRFACSRCSLQSKCLFYSFLKPKFFMGKGNLLSVFFFQLSSGSCKLQKKHPLCASMKRTME